MSNMFDKAGWVHGNGLALAGDWGYVHLIASTKLEVMHYANFGLNVIVPDRFIPHVELEPFTEDDFKQAFIRTDWAIKPMANIFKLKSIIRKQKMKHEL